MLADNDTQKSERLAFCEAYVEKIVDTLTDPLYDGDWSIADTLFNQCPRHYLSDVAFLFLTHHFIAVYGLKKEEMY